jgi:hypothetical protein
MDFELDYTEYYQDYNFDTTNINNYGYIWNDVLELIKTKKKTPIRITIRVGEYSSMDFMIINIDYNLIVDRYEKLCKRYKKNETVINHLGRFIIEIFFYSYNTKIHLLEDKDKIERDNKLSELGI